MTKPAAARSRGGFDDGPRIYEWPHPDSGLEPEFEVVSVTSATGCYPKPFLIPWAVKMTAERAVDKYRRLGEMIEEDGEKEALAWLKKARYTSSGVKADRGTIVHSTLEAYLADERLERTQIEEHLRAARIPRTMWRSTFGMVDGLMQFFDDHQPKVHWSETTVYSREHGYAGTPDVVAEMEILGKMRPAIIDVKTSKDIYNDTCLQLCGYARADFVGERETGRELPLLPKPKPIEYGVVVRPLASGGYDHAVFELNDDVFDVFLACLRLALASDVVNDARKGRL